MSVAGKQPPPAPLERPGSLLVPTWASIRDSHARPGTDSRSRSGRAAPTGAEGGREAPAGGERAAGHRLSLPQQEERCRPTKGSPGPWPGRRSLSARGCYLSEPRESFGVRGRKRGGGSLRLDLCGIALAREAGSWERLATSWQRIWHIIYKWCPLMVVLKRPWFIKLASSGTSSVPFKVMMDLMI